MRIPIVGTLEAKFNHGEPMPLINAQSVIEYKSDDGTNHRVFFVDKVRSMEIVNGRYEYTFGLPEPEPKRWQVVITDRRITLLHPMHLGLFGKKPKLKPGKCSGGHVYFSQIISLEAGLFDEKSSYLNIVCERDDYTKTWLTLTAAETAVTKDIVRTLHTNISNYLKASGRLQENPPADWTSLSDNDDAWNIPANDKTQSVVSVKVPCTQYEAVRNTYKR